MLKYWKSILWTIIILLLLLLPGEKMPQHRLFQIQHLDKLAHFCLFFVLRILVLCEGGIYPRLSRVDALVFLLCALFAVCSELLQFIPFTNRDPSLFDFFADMLGLLVGGLILRMAYRFKFLSSPPRN